MIEVKMRGDKWRLVVSNEEWEFSSIKELKQVVEDLIDLKDEFGDIELKKKKSLKAEIYSDLSLEDLEDDE